MRKLTAVTPATTSLPRELRLLLAPIRIGGSDSAARSEGVILDDAARVVAFIVRASPAFASGGRRTLVPVTALSPTGEAGLELTWSEEKLRQHPWLDEPDPTAEPEGSRRDGVSDRTFDGAAAGTALGVGFGAIAAFAFPPLGVLAIAAAFGFGGLLAGAAAGAAGNAVAKEGAAPKEEIQEHSPDFAVLEQALQSPTFLDARFVRVTHFDEAHAPAAIAKAAGQPIRRADGLRERMRVLSADGMDLGAIILMGDQTFRVEKGHLLQQDLDIPFKDVASVEANRVVLTKRRHDYVEASNGEPMVTTDELKQVARGDLPLQRFAEAALKL